MKKKDSKKTSIGGQAVMEGVMMRGKTSMATAVRDADGIIRIETKRLKANGKRNAFLKLPIIRGIVNFFSSFVVGTKTLMRSAEVYGEGEPSKFEKWCAKKLKVNITSVVIFFSLVLGLGLAVALFIYAPIKAREGLELLFKTEFGNIAKNFIEGGFKILIFILYIVIVSLLKDIRRTFEYHGAEHKTISCYEKGLELTPENAKKCSRLHNRCGTTFMFFVMLISILVFALVEALFAHYNVEIEKLYRVLLKIVLLPLVAGLSYELLKGLAKTDFFLFYPLKLPGLLLQKLTTKEPDEKQLEVAITAFNEVMKMDEDLTIAERDFVVAEKRNKLLERIKKKLKDNGIEEDAEAEWIISICLNVPRSSVNQDVLVNPKDIDRIEKLVNERITGRPLWYCIGDTEFFDLKINVDERVLIPRPETEQLVEEALKYIDSTKVVLDLCTGSGAIAIAVATKTGAKVVAVDVSEGALELAQENAKLNSASVEFIKSDLFEELGERKFDIIISNPPYIPSEDVKQLQREVRDFEPTLALDGGKDGLDFYIRITKEASLHMVEDGLLAFEIGIYQGEAVAEMCKAVGFGAVAIRKDYAGIERMVFAAKEGGKYADLLLEIAK